MTSRDDCGLWMGDFGIGGFSIIHTSSNSPLLTGSNKKAFCQNKQKAFLFQL